MSIISLIWTGNKVAVQASIQIVRAFVRIRQLIASSEPLARKIEQLERKMEVHDLDIDVLDLLITELMEQPKLRGREEEPEQEIGFLADQKKDKKRKW